PVGGVMVFGKTPNATKELNRQIQQGQVKKTYLCVVTKDLSSQIQEEPKLLTDYLQKDAKNNCSKIVSANEKNAKKAQLYYKVLAVKEGFSLIEVDLLTGRHHQIRVQIAAHIAGIYGDSKYNSTHTVNGEWKNIALFSNSITFTHPKTKKELYFTISPSGDIWDKFIP
ncbi:MAG: RNA pseudouridine synthase, partial [Bacilli bacterium]|nr:RNA pseudouridine synthase [Bacilli bacterium]